MSSGHVQKSLQKLQVRKVCQVPVQLTCSIVRTGFQKHIKQDNVILNDLAKKKHATQVEMNLLPSRKTREKFTLCRKNTDSGTGGRSTYKVFPERDPSLPPPFYSPFGGTAKKRQRKGRGAPWTNSGRGSSSSWRTRSSVDNRYCHVAQCASRHRPVAYVHLVS